MEDLLRGLVEKVSLFTWSELVTALGGIWLLVLAANYFAKITPNKTDNKLTGRAKELFRRLMRLVGAEPPVKDQRR